MFLFRPLDLVRNMDFVREHFYPPRYQRKAIAQNTEGESFDHTDYAYILNSYVDSNGIVNYGGLLKDSTKLDSYIDRLSGVELDKLSRHERISVLLNAYNAFTLKLIVENKGVKSIKDISEKRRWKDNRWILGGQTVSLDHLEHVMMRKTYGDARIHFALVCAAVSCPKLRKEPYAGDNLMCQLEDQARDFFSKDSNFRWDSENNTVYLSEILDWFRNDFANDEMGVINYISKYLIKASASEISEADNVKIKYIPYDWSLNGTWD